MQSTQWLRAVVLAVFDSLLEEDVRLRHGVSEFFYKGFFSVSVTRWKKDCVVTLAQAAKDMGECLHQNERKE
jgi:hypothetical protein